MEEILLIITPLPLPSSSSSQPSLEDVERLLDFKNAIANTRNRCGDVQFFNFLGGIFDIETTLTLLVSIMS